MEVGAWLQSIGLGGHAQAFEDAGYTDLEYIASLGEDARIVAEEEIKLLPADVEVSWASPGDYAAHHVCLQPRRSSLQPSGRAPRSFRRLPPLPSTRMQRTHRPYRQRTLFVPCASTRIFPTPRTLKHWLQLFPLHCAQAFRGVPS